MDAQQTSRETENRLLDPVDRVSEILFRLIMAATIVGSLSIASAGRNEVRAVMFAALGCDLAWGLVDAVMCLVRTATDRARRRALARAALAAGPAESRRLIQQALPAGLTAIVGEAELDGMRRRLATLPIDGARLLGGRGVLEAGAIFLLVLLATFPVVVPFMLLDNLPQAMQMTRVITLVSLSLAGMALGRVAGYKQPLHIGLTMALFGAVLIVAVMALGG
jgi:hypothetical protein